MFTLTLHYTIKRRGSLSEVDNYKIDEIHRETGAIPRVRSSAAPGWS